MTRLRKSKEHRGIVPIVDAKTKRVYCPLCFNPDVKMNYNDIGQVWECPRCGHQAYSKLSQIALSKSELKASNDFYQSTQKFFIGSGEREHRRIAAFPLKRIYSKTNVYQSLAEANEATNIPHEYDT